MRTILSPYSFCTGQDVELEDDLYRIGTVANLTEISVERLRAGVHTLGVCAVEDFGDILDRHE